MARDPAQQTTAESLPAPRDRAVRVGPGSDRQRRGGRFPTFRVFAPTNTARRPLSDQRIGGGGAPLGPRQGPNTTRRCGRRSRGPLRGGGEGGVRADDGPPCPRRLVEPAALGEAKPADRRRPPAAAADFLSRMSTPTHHEARPLKHKKERNVGTVALAAGLIGFCDRRHSHGGLLLQSVGGQRRR